jgi:tRNA 2-thiouridine synthesizing protein A
MSSAGDSVTVTTLDLRGEICPFTFVRTKLAMEKLAIGSSIHVTVDNQHAADNVPRSLRTWGQEVCEVEMIPADQNDSSASTVWRIVTIRRV